MESNSFPGNEESAIENLQSILNDTYLASEKIMSFRNPEIKALNKSVAKLEDSYDNLIKLMSSNMVPSQTIRAVAIKKLQFNTQISDWFTRTGNMSFSKDTTSFDATPLAQLNTIPNIALMVKARVNLVGINLFFS